jgi:hypothetical protein
VRVPQSLRTASLWSVGTAGAVAAAWAGCAGASWLRYGRVQRATPEERDALLDRFLPEYDVVERHHIGVAAPAATTFRAACEANLMQSPLVRAMFRTREVVLGGRRDTTKRPDGLMALTRSIGWGVLAERPGREIVMGAATQPWKADAVAASAVVNSSTNWPNDSTRNRSRLWPPSKRTGSPSRHAEIPRRMRSETSTRSRCQSFVHDKYLTSTQRHAML